MAPYPLISVILPAHNAAAYIRQALESVVAQTYSHIEVLAVDDGSTDETAAIIQQFSQQDRRVICLQQSNSGVAAARNFAISQSQGEFIAPLDADDIWYPQKLARQMDCFQRSSSEVGLVYAWSVFLDEQGRRQSICQCARTEGDVLIPLIFQNFPGNASSPLIRRTCLNKLGTYDERYKAMNAQGCEDWDLYLRIAERYQFRVVPELLIGYRQIVGSMSYNHAPMEKACELMMSSLSQRHPDLPAVLFQCSIAHFIWYIALKCWRSGDYGKTLHYLYRSAQMDALHLLHLNFYLMTLSSVINILVKPFTQLLWTDHLSWVRFYSRYLRFYREPKLEMLQIRQSSVNQRFPRKYFNQLMNNRVSYIEQVSKRKNLNIETIDSKVKT
jgi:glycosyltransferase involved in cell wall biosynthesis